MSAEQMMTKMLWQYSEPLLEETITVPEKQQKKIRRPDGADRYLEENGSIP